VCDVDVDKARLERRIAEKGQVHFYLAKDVRIGSKKAKVTKYLGSVEPSLEELENLMVAAAYELEVKALNKRAELSAARYPSSPFNDREGAALIFLLEKFRFLHRSLQRHLRTDEMARYGKMLEHQYVWGSTSIEGNTLTLRETRLLLDEGLIPQGRSMREINEVQNFGAVQRYRDAHKGRITLGTIKRLHALIMNNIDVHSAGEFRRVDDIGIVGRSGLLTPSSLIVEELTGALEHYYRSLEDGVHPFFAAVIFHHRFESVHPFTDGNGRVGRELLNTMLSASKFPRLLFLGQDRSLYLKALDLGDQGDEAAMIDSFARLLISQRKDVALEKLRQLTGK
jgi:Fic family protein